MIEVNEAELLKSHGVEIGLTLQKDSSLFANRVTKYSEKVNLEKSLSGEERLGIEY